MAVQSESDFYAIVGKALTEPGFREALHEDDFVAALREEGIELTREQMATLKSAIAAVDAMREEFSVDSIAAT